MFDQIKELYLAVSARLGLDEIFLTDKVTNESWAEFQVAEYARPNIFCSKTSLLSQTLINILKEEGVQEVTSTKYYAGLDTKQVVDVFKNRGESILAKFQKFCDSEKVKNAIQQRNELVSALKKRNLQVRDGVELLVVTDPKTLNSEIVVTYLSNVNYAHQLASECKLPLSVKVLARNYKSESKLDGLAKSLGMGLDNEGYGNKLTQFAISMPNANSPELTQYLDQLQTIYPIYILGRRNQSNMSHFINHLMNVPNQTRTLALYLQDKLVPNITVVLTLLLATVKCNPQITVIQNLDALVPERAVEEEKKKALLKEIKHQLAENQRASQDKKAGAAAETPGQSYVPAKEVVDLFEIYRLSIEHLHFGFYEFSRRKDLPSEEVGECFALRIYHDPMRDVVVKLASQYRLPILHVLDPAIGQVLEFDLTKIDLTALRSFLSTMRDVQPIQFGKASFFRDAAANKEVSQEPSNERKAGPK